MRMLTAEARIDAHRFRSGYLNEKDYGRLSHALGTLAEARVFIDDKFFCDTVPLDRLANMHRERRRIAGDADPLATRTGLDPLALIEDEHYRRTRLITVAPDDDDAD